MRHGYHLKYLKINRGVSKYLHTKSIKGQSMSPIAKIEIAIAIPIPIFIKNWDRDPDPDLHLKDDRRSRPWSQPIFWAILLVICHVIILYRRSHKI